VPPAPGGIRAFSGEVIVMWDPAPVVVGVAHDRVYQNRQKGAFWLLAVVTADALGTLEPGRIGIVDAPDYWPWPLLGPTQRCYVGDDRVDEWA
jgi:hypothetical protein